MDRVSGIQATGRQPEVIVLSNTDSASDEEASFRSSTRRGTKWRSYQGPCRLDSLSPEFPVYRSRAAGKSARGTKRTAPTNGVSWRGNYSKGEPLAFVDTTKPAPSPTPTGGAASAHRAGSPQDENIVDPSTPQESSSSLDFTITAAPPKRGTGAPSKQNWFRQSIPSP